MQHALDTDNRVRSYEVAMSIMASARFDAEVLALPDVPVVARRLAVSGSNVQIGRAVTELAIARYGMRPEDLLGDGRYVRARRTYFRRNYPIHLRRMRGVAGAFGLHPDDDRFDFSILRSKRRPAVPSNLNADSTYTPPAASETGSGTLSRWADLQNKVEDQLELYIMEWRSVGASIASVAVHVDDLLSGTIAGINATGLAVSAVGTGSTGNGAADRPTRLGGVQTVGLHELQLMRLVLDTCRSVDDAQAALLAARDYQTSGPARYLVADADGRSFVYEVDPSRRAQGIVDGGGDPQTIRTGREPEPQECGWGCVIDQQRRSLELRFRSGGTQSLGAQFISTWASAAGH